MKKRGIINLFILVFMLVICMNFVSAEICPDNMLAYWHLEEKDASVGGPNDFVRDIYSTPLHTTVIPDVLGNPEHRIGLFNMEWDGGIIYDGLFAGGFLGGNSVFFTHADDWFNWFPAQKGTVELWIYPEEIDTASSYDVRVFDYDTQIGAFPDRNHIFIKIQGGKLIMALQEEDYGNPFAISTAHDLEEKKWYHLAVAWDNSPGVNEARFYFNGEEEIRDISYMPDWTASTQFIVFGAYAPTMGRIRIDEAAIYGEAIDYSTILEHYNDGEGKGYCIRELFYLGSNDYFAHPYSQWYSSNTNTRVSLEGIKTKFENISENGKSWQSINVSGLNSKLQYPTTYEIGPQWNRETKYNFNNDGGTVMMWVKPYWNNDESDSNNHMLFQNFIFGELNWYITRYGDSKELQAYMHCNGQPGRVIRVYNLPWKKNTWHQIAMTWNSDSLSFFIDGVRKGQDTGSCSIPTATGDYLNIGNKEAGTDGFKGLIDSVAIYPYAMPTSEIQWEYDNTMFVNIVNEQETYEFSAEEGSLDVVFNYSGYPTTYTIGIEKEDGSFVLYEGEGNLNQDIEKGTHTHHFGWNKNKEAPSGTYYVKINTEKANGKQARLDLPLLILTGQPYCKILSPSNPIERGLEGSLEVEFQHYRASTYSIDIEEKNSGLNLYSSGTLDIEESGAISHSCFWNWDDRYVGEYKVTVKVCEESGCDTDVFENLKISKFGDTIIQSGTELPFFGIMEFIISLMIIGLIYFAYLFFTYNRT